ncbi:MAG TPA: transporter associated domain-containing protein [Steroidobacter sp.]|nr:transporter associated domain-containing protein [Steroidobacteraceae bacterium]HLS79963.1 transporter associated domain-containing protein [Steroidobacter sp.]
MNDPATAVLLTTLALIAVALLAGVFGFRLGSRAARATRSRRTHAASERSRLTNRLLDLETSTVDDIMIPRNEIASIDLEDDWNTILDVLRSTPHTRLPVHRGALDNIVGMLHMKKAAHALARGDFCRERLAALAAEREAYFTPEGTPLSVQLLNFQRDRRRIALVVDEYGDIQGLVTLEDILEEIVGDFTSAPAALHKDIHRENDGAYVISGSVHTRVLNRTLGWNLPTNGPRTLNGLILEHLETIPQPGERFTLGDFSFEILQIVDNGVKTVRIRPGEGRRAVGRSEGVA